MKKTHIIFILIALLVFVCFRKTETEPQIKKTFDKIIVDNGFDSILNKFLLGVNTDSTICEMYYDIISPWTSKIILIKIPYYKEYFRSQKALFYYENKDGKLIYIYNGLEYLFKGDDKNRLQHFENISESDKIWKVDISFEFKSHYNLIKSTTFKVDTLPDEYIGFLYPTPFKPIHKKIKQKK